VPESVRGLLWKSVTGALDLYADRPSFYADTLHNVFGERIPKQILRIPVFGGAFKPEDHYLTPEGVACARKVLCIIGMEHPEIDFLPCIPDLGKYIVISHSNLFSLYVASFYERRRYVCYHALYAGTQDL
jgi:hypothetical protein